MHSHAGHRANEYDIRHDYDPCLSHHTVCYGPQYNSCVYLYKYVSPFLAISDPLTVQNIKQHILLLKIVPASTLTVQSEQYLF